MAIHSSTIAWKIPWTEEPGRLQSMGWQRVRHDWATSLYDGKGVFFRGREECIGYQLIIFLEGAEGNMGWDQITESYDYHARRSEFFSVMIEGSLMYLHKAVPDFSKRISNSCAKAKKDDAKVKKGAQSCPALCDPMDCSLTGSSVHGVFQAIILEWVAISFSRGSSWFREQTHVSCVLCNSRWILYH